MCIRIISVYLLLEYTSQLPVSCYQNHTALSSIVFTNIEPPADDVHSEYYYGKCASKDKVLLAHDHWVYDELKELMILRAWLNVQEEPTCVYIRSRSSYGDFVRYHAFKFNVCVCRLVYNYGGQKFTYYYYEWFIPVEMKRNINWDLYFYV